MSGYEDWTFWFRSGNIGPVPFRPMSHDEIMAKPTGVEHIAFVAEATQEMLRLIVDVQQNRNRPEDLP